MGLQDRDYVALTAIGEARGEPIEGIVGVCFVIRNRAYSRRKLYRDICLEPKQFSCWNDDDRNFKLLQHIINDMEMGNTLVDPYTRQCVAVANAVVNQDFIDNVRGAQNYVNERRYSLAKARQDPKLDGWINRLKVVATLGKHVFLA